jgi:hypothetical protein
MLKKIKEICLSLGLFSLIAVPVLAPAVAYADFTTQDIKTNLCNGSNADVNDTSGGCATADAGGNNIEALMVKIIQIFSVIVGFIAVIMIIVGGVKYITSGGDSGNISGAKNTIIYAIIGLIIVAVAQLVVHFVLKNVNQATTG